MLWPPRWASVPPMKTTSARENRPLKFADGIEQQDAGRISGWRASGRSRGADTEIRPLRASAPRTSKRSGLRGARISGRSGCARRSSPESRDHGVVFVRSPLGGGMVLAAIQTLAGRTGASHARHRRCGSGARASKSYLKLPAVADALSGGAPSRQEPRARSRPICARMESAAGSTAAKKPAQPAVAAEGAVGDAAVDHGQARAGALHFAKQVGPDLGLRHHHHGRPQRAQHAPHREDVIHRRVEDAVGETRPASDRRWRVRPASRWKRRAGCAGSSRAQAADQFHAGQHFAHRNCVQPDGAGTGLSKGAWKKSEALRQGAPVAAVSQAAITGNTITGQAEQTPEGPGRGNRCLLFSNVWLFL